MELEGIKFDNNFLIKLERDNIRFLITRIENDYQFSFTFISSRDKANKKYFLCIL